MSQPSHDHDLRTAEELIAHRAGTEPRVVIIEGPNYGGKSLCGRLLRSVLPGVTCIEQHDFFHFHVLRAAQLRPRDVVEVSAWRKLKPSIRDRVLTAVDRREHEIAWFANTSDDDVLVERLLLTNYVYKRLLFDLDSADSLRRCSDLLAREGVMLALLTAPVDDIMERMKEDDGPKRLRQRSSQMPRHLKDEGLIRDKVMLYDEAFNLDLPFHKLRLDTVSLSPGKCVEAILQVLWPDVDETALVTPGRQTLAGGGSQPGKG